MKTVGYENFTAIIGCRTFLKFLTFFASKFTHFLSYFRCCLILGVSPSRTFRFEMLYNIKFCIKCK